MRSFESIVTQAGNSDDNKDIPQDNPEIVGNRTEKLSKPVYFIESSNDGTVLVGIDVTIRRAEDDTTVSWYDTTRERVMTATETSQEEDRFVFKRAEEEGGGTYSFTPMDLETYNNKVKQRLLAGPDFTNEEDMIKGFLSTIDDA